ncbi:hypothetical protein KJA15_03585 [Patescibacteria group bacterium]|nr:hypothetical protein [Patescibacteria group bacterium]
MTLTEQIIKFKRKGFSEREIAEKLNLTQQAISLHIVKAKKEGLWNGESGSEILEFDLTPEEPLDSEGKKEPKKITLEGKKPKIKGAFRCSRCHKPLIPIEEVSFNPSKLGTMLKEAGISHVCIECKLGYARESVEPEKEYLCPECRTKLIKFVHGKKFLGYWCPNCETLYEKGDKILRKKQAKKEVE